MPGETLPIGKKPSVGLIIADDYQTRNQRRKNDRIGIMWSDGDGTVDYEPKAWLKVINESR
jgi:hypothetical protein